MHTKVQSVFETFFSTKLALFSESDRSTIVISSVLPAAHSFNRRQSKNLHYCLVQPIKSQKKKTKKTSVKAV